MKKMLAMAVGLLMIWGASVANASDVDWDVAAGVAVPFTSGYNPGFWRGKAPRDSTSRRAWI